MKKPEQPVTVVTNATDVTDPWQLLRRHTAARIGLGRVGSSQTTADTLRFSLAHAQARDAVHLALDKERLATDLIAADFRPVFVASQAVDRATYLLRPDLGRSLSPASERELAQVQSQSQFQSATPPVAAGTSRGERLVFMVGDGLSAKAVQDQAVRLIQSVRDRLAPVTHWAPVVIAEQARVALGDEVASQLAADLVVVLIGERPGLSSPDSMGIYLTYAPEPGLPDSRRNCISNVRPDGLDINTAADRLVWFIQQARRRQISGVVLKDNSAEKTLESASETALKTPARSNDGDV